MGHLATEPREAIKQLDSTVTERLYFTMHIGSRANRKTGSEAIRGCH